MFFLLRTAFWLTIVLALIPLGAPHQAEATDPSGVDPVSALFAAQATMSDIGGFCGRNPQACETGGQALSAIGSQAAVGAGIVLSYLDRTFFDGEDRSGPTQTAVDAPATLPAPEVYGQGAAAALATGSISSLPLAASGEAGTLTRQDLSLPWAVGQAETVKSAPDALAQGAPIGPLPRPNPRAGKAGPGAGSQADKV